MAFLLDLRCADDILLFAGTAADAMAVLDDLVHKLQNIGLPLNTGSAAIFLAYPRWGEVTGSVATGGTQMA